MGSALYSLRSATEIRSRIGLGIVYFIDLGESFRLRV